VPPERINAHLRAVTEQTSLDEIWITDSRGHAYLRNRAQLDFTFSPDPKKQPQASAFWPLLTGQRRVVVQAAQKREVDSEIYKYVGVAGIDRPRIVQVGYHADLLQGLQSQLGLEALLNEIMRTHAIVAIRVVDQRLKTLASAVAPGNTLPSGLGRDASSLWAAAREGDTVADLEGDLLKVVTPVVDRHGTMVAAAIIYLPTVQVREQVQRVLQLSALVAALVLGFGALAAVALSRRVTGPVEQLIAASAAVEAGSFQPEMLASVVRRTDELGRLARVFEEMAREVRSREQRLQQQVQQLRIEVDQSRKAKQVADITETDYFKQLRNRATDLRRKLAEEG